MNSDKNATVEHKPFKPKIKKESWKKLKISLKYRPKIYALILNLRHKIRRQDKLIQTLKQKLKNQVSCNNVEVSCQTETEKAPISNEVTKTAKDTAWQTGDLQNGDSEKSIAEQVKEAAQSALSQSGMVYVESAGMYYDYKTGYYYNSELGLYYHTDTSCYYSYSEDKKEFVFHSYPDTSKAASEAFIKHEKRKAKKHKQDKEKDAPMKPKRLKKTKEDNKKEDTEEKEGDRSESKIAVDLEDGECSDTASENGMPTGGEASDDSTSTDSDDDSVVKHHPPCMRVIVKETKVPNLKVGSLFLITKDGGTIGREGEHHVIVLKEHNVSRNHLEIRYDMDRRSYVATDLGSKNGTLLNGNRMAHSQLHSEPMEIPHGSTLQLGESRLLCHVHPGHDTCGHCEPGLLMAAEEKDKKVAYTRTCSVQKQYHLELARLKNKYAPEPLAIEDGSYNDRARLRREAVGSSHGAEKTQQADLDTNVPADNKGFKMLEKMGWAKGEGLGKNKQGDADPIPLVSNETKAGLGAAGSAVRVAVGAIGSMPLRVSSRKTLRPPAKLFRDPLEEDD